MASVLQLIIYLNSSLLYAFMAWCLVKKEQFVVLFSP